MIKWLVIIVLLYSSSGCTPESSTAIKIEKAEVPARYSAPLPATMDEMKSWIDGDPTIAPLPHVVENILYADRRWLGRFSAAASEVKKTEGPDWARSWDRLFEYQSVDESFCKWARTVMKAEPTTLRAAISGAFVRTCTTEHDRSMIMRADTPYWAVLEYFDPWNQNPLNNNANIKRRLFHPRLVEAAREAILRDPVFDARSAAFALANLREPKAEQALLSIHAEVNDQDRADQVAMAFLKTNNAEGRKRAEKACLRRSNDAMCTAKTGDDIAQAREQKRIPIAVVKARIAQMAKLGFRELDKLKIEELNTDAAEAILLAAGQAYWFDVETGMFPNQHDSLMRSLARLVKPALDNVVIEEQAPQIGSSAPYILRVYASGKVYRTWARNLGDWYDVESVLRLMNSVMQDNNAEQRFFGLATTDQTMIIVAASPKAIQNAVKAGLLQLGHTGEAERIGKEFEERVLRSLQ